MSVKSIILICVSTIFLGTGFFNNFWHSADQNWFDNHQLDTEGQVIGRMVKARRDGIFSDGGLTGWVSGGEIENKKIVNAQYEAYYQDLDFNKFSPYFSQIGFQGITFSVIDKIIPLNPKSYVVTLKFLNSYFFASVLSIVTIWIYFEFGIFSAVTVLITAIFSQWMTVFGRNLWWVMWAFYLPFLASIQISRKKIRFRYAILLIFTSVFVKCLCNGYEYITTTLLMMITPFIYFWLIEDRDLKFLIKQISVFGTTAIVSVLTTTPILAWQISKVKGSLSAGFHHIFVYSVGKRTHGDPSDFPKIYANSLKADVLTVVNKYLKGFIFDLNHIFRTSTEHLKITYLTVIAIFLIISILLFCLYFIPDREIFSRLKRDRKKLIALSITTWFSFLAPLSWMVIFKSHSYIHTHMNFITWHMPFTLFGFALLGAFAIRASGDLFEILRKKVN